MQFVRVVHNITKEYPDMIKVKVFKEPRVFITDKDVCHFRREQAEIKDYVPSYSSIMRTKQTIRDIVLCNDFELFVTFTFDPAKVDRYNYHACSYKMRVWLHHQRDLANRRGKDFKYLIIPERHKDGAIHFHALLSGYSSTLHDSGLRTQELRPIYNVTSFRSGFTTAVFVDSKDGVSSYITKYITKELLHEFKKQRFFCSQGLIRPRKIINSHALKDTLPLYRLPVSENANSFDYILPLPY